MAESSTHTALEAAELPSLRAAGRTRWLRRAAWLCLLLLFTLPIALAFAPWRQSLPGTGRVIEFDPVDRPMPIQARTSGVVLRWHVREGQRIEAGAPIVDLGDNDPEILQRLADQITAAQEKKAASERKRADYERQAGEAESAREAAIRVAAEEIIAAEQALESAKQAVRVAEATVQLNAFLQEMFEGLIADDIAPGFELERAKQQAAIAAADLEARRAQVAAAEAALRARRSARERVERDEQVKIQSVKALRNTAEGEVAEAESSILRLQRDLERQRQQSLVAPVAGTVQRLLANGQGGGYVSEGTTLAVLVPHSKQLAVELRVDGNDVTFVRIGSHVRLQFEGWPAVQFVGWPSAAVGTFGGKVAFIDRFDQGDGSFRVMVLPDPRPFEEPEWSWSGWLRRRLTHDSVASAENPHAWPDESWLRQGVHAKGWILLDEVSIGYEIWRNLNGFPPSLQTPPSDPALYGDGAGSKSKSKSKSSGEEKGK
ncbi:MAG: HlyD family efflux transporter periplasmic adaptor subunit [Planctomycetes bacterium]|nr:HlyD family efflux transporter periplasmic adaptor subunit [Planctomycetota bacterium]